MRLLKIISIVVGLMCLAASATPATAGQVWTKCHITCRCLQTNNVGNFQFMLPIDRVRDMTYEADLACKAQGHNVCSDGCNGLKFSYTYKVTSP